LNILDLNFDTTYKSFIKSNHLTNYNEPFYVNNIVSDKIKKYSWLSISVILNVILILLIFLGLKFQKKKSQINKQKNEVIVNTAFDHENRNLKYYIHSLSTIEKDLLLLLFKNNLQKQNTTVTQINKVLGTEKKPFKIQNNIRGEVLTTLNNKFMAFALVNNNLIERQRSDYDKRHMEYFINEKYISKLSLKLFQV
jgi:hypothetical protein